MKNFIIATHNAADFMACWVQTIDPLE